MKLIDIEIDEVSLVSKGANKRTFAIIKNVEGKVEGKQEEAKTEPKVEVKIETKVEQKEEVNQETKVAEEEEFDAEDEKELENLLAVVTELDKGIN